MKRRYRRLSVGFALAALSLFVQVAGLAVHQVIDHHPRDCDSRCESTPASPFTGTQADDAWLAGVITPSQALDCWVCEALQQLRPEADSVHLPEVGPADLVAAAPFTVASDPIRSASKRTYSSRGPPSLLS